MTLMGRQGRRSRAIRRAVSELRSARLLRDSVRRGGMAEWSMAVVLKTTVPGRVPGVRIPLPPTYVAARIASRSFNRQAAKAPQSVDSGGATVVSSTCDDIHLRLGTPGAFDAGHR